MNISLRNVEGEVVGSVEVRDDVFGAPMNSALVHQVMVGQQANARQGTANVKTRAQVSGGGAKPRPQKHTGRARQGSIRSPQWRGGGVVFGPAPRSYRHRTPKRMRRGSLVAMLSDKARSDQLVVLDELKLDRAKTKDMVNVLHALGAGPSVLLVADGAGKTIFRSTRNIPRLKTLPASLLNTVDLLNHRTLVMTLDSVRRVEELWSGEAIRRKRHINSNG